MHEGEANYCRGTIVSDKARQQLREPSARELDQQGMVGAMTSSGSSKSAAVIINLQREYHDVDVQAAVLPRCPAVLD